MTISSTTNRNGYTGNDTSSNFDYSFKIFQNADVLLTIRDTATDTEEILVIEQDYTVNDAGEDNGGTIDLVDSGQAWLSGTGNLDTGYLLVIRRVLALTQETDIRNQGDFYPELHEDVFDKITMTDQQQQDEIDRCVRLPETVSPDDFDTTIPAGIVGQNGLALVSNVAGDGFAVGPSIGAIEGAQDNANAAAASAIAAAASAVTSGDEADAAAISAAAAQASADEAAAIIDTDLINDLTPQLGGNLDTNGKEISDVAGYEVVINDNLYVTGQAYGNHQTTLIPTGTTQTIDWDNGNSVVLDLDSATGSVTLTLSNPVAGASYIIEVVQGDTTARDLVYPANVTFPDGSAPIISTSLGSVDIITLFYNGTNYRAGFNQNYS